MHKMAVLFLLGVVICAPFVSSAHYIVGRVSPAYDNSSGDGRTVVLWNPSNGIADNITGLVGSSGSSGVANTYLLDCELLSTPCVVSDVLNVTLVDDGSGYNALFPVNVSVSGFGFDIAPNISMNTPPTAVNVTVDDQFSSPQDEIDLTAASSTSVSCSGVVVEYDGIGTLTNYSAVLYSLNSSLPGAADDNNVHYSNSTCQLNTSYGGPTQATINCTFDVEYYAVAESWACLLSFTDEANASSNASDATVINPLLALGANDMVSFGLVSAEEVSNESVMQLVNYGNVMVNLSLSGYGSVPGDGFAMSCNLSGNISIEQVKYNLSSSTPGSLSLSQALLSYTNLSSSPVTEEFNFVPRSDDFVNDAVNYTYWRTFLPKGVAGNCTGSVIMGAVQS